MSPLLSITATELLRNLSLIKTKAGTTYVNNELAALKKRVKGLKATVGKLQKTVEFYAEQLRINLMLHRQRVGKI